MHMSLKAKRMMTSPSMIPMKKMASPVPRVSRLIFLKPA